MILEGGKYKGKDLAECPTEYLEKLIITWADRTYVEEAKAITQSRRSMGYFGPREVGYGSLPTYDD